MTKNWSSDYKLIVPKCNFIFDTKTLRYRVQVLQPVFESCAFFFTSYNIIVVFGVIINGNEVIKIK